MTTCLCISPDLEEVAGYMKCKVCNNWFNTGLWEDHWKGKVDNAVERNSINRNDPCPCQSGKKYKKCCIPQKARRWIKINNSEAFKAVQTKGVVEGNETISDKEERIKQQTERQANHEN